MSRTVLNAKTPNTLFSAVFNFAFDLAIGETISSASTTPAVYSGTDPAPAALIYGTARIAGAYVTQDLINGVLGVTYTLICNALTSAGRTISRQAFIVIVPEPA